LYDLTARTIKKADLKLRVGGPATAQTSWVDRFIAHCLGAGVPFDFVSTHIYGNESPKDVFGSDAPVDIKGMVPRALTKVHNQVAQSGAPQTPIVVSEFNASYLNRVDIEDSAFMGPWLASTIRACDGLTFMMSYWTFSDAFEEQGVVKRPFYGGFGLVAERGIPKAAFRAFQLLHQLGDQRLDSISDDSLITRRPDGTLVIAVWNYAGPGQSGHARTIQLHLKNRREVKCQLQRVGRGHGSALEEWIRMGSPDYPANEQIARLIDASRITAATRRLSEPITLEPDELALLEVKP
jgi:xylan 1,4-beta-xylosidase